MNEETQHAESGNSPPSSSLVAEATSAAGRRVTLTLDCNKYHGARPYLTATYWRKEKAGAKPKAAVQMFTPFEPRGRSFFAGMLRDEIDSARLAQDAPRCLASVALRAGQTTLAVGNDR